MALGGKRKPVGNVNHGVVAEPQQVFGHINFAVADVGADRNPGLFFEQPGQIAGRHPQRVRQILNGDPLLDMGVDVFLAGIDVLGVGVAVVVTAHLLGVVHHHLVVQVLDLVGGMDIVQLLDIKIAQPECPFQLHAVLAAHPGHHGRGDHEMIFQVGDGVPGQNANPFCIHKTALLAIFADSIHIAVGHGTVEQKLLAGFTVLHLIDVIVGLDYKPFIFVAHCRISLNRFLLFCLKSRVHGILLWSNIL